MPEISKRYVAEIDMPEGIVSIDCDVRGNRIFLITLQLNNSTLSFNDAVLSPFLEGLVNDKEVVIEYKSSDVRPFIISLLKNEFKGYSDITLTEVDTD